jgi:hypothetical protein
MYLKPICLMTKCPDTVANAPISAFRSQRVGGDDAMRTFEDGTGGGTRASV